MPSTRFHACWADGSSSLDERGVAGLQFYQELVKNSPPSATTWTWDGQGQALTQGQAAMAITWGEDFPGFDANDSKVKGLFEALPAPKEVPGRRAVADCGFNEIPAVGHQGGSTISLSQYSKNKEAAWYVPTHTPIFAALAFACCPA
ncbi:extracellular solute-binding protein [Mesorhizobium sp. M7A.F.Ca.US.010.02.1.1]|nr:extracellular solute-binding protein [Mesorhizobium sp. M7A.F.Ca.US.010.02.1.1]